MTASPTGRERFALAMMLSMLTVLGPLNIDMYLPAFPEIASDLSTSQSLVQASLTACLLGLAAGQLVIGPISDARGRRGPLMISVSLFVLASVVCALAPNITTLIIGRFLQGFTAAAGLVVSRAVVRDVFDGKELTKFFALLMVINAVAPIVAPLAGGAILIIPGMEWDGIFYTLAAMGLLVVLIVFFRLKETLPAERRSPGSLKHTLATFYDLMRTRTFMGFALALGFAHGGSFAYVAGTPFVYQSIYEVSPQMFSVLFGINGLAMVIGSHVIGRYSGVVREQTLLYTALIIGVAATSVLLVMTIIEGPLFMIVVPIFIYMTGMGMILTSSFTLAIEKEGHRAGSASALLGVFPLLIGAAVAPLVGMSETSAIPMGFILFATSALAFLSYVVLIQRSDQR
ncbi:Bcr/CflA family efflux MFS transporter [Geomicrobium sp. JSM 1781026]|uniref:Bcr/CflA family efflux MFS transporter n=1 Tax=Geomicrobium sp. JSM 1781026 TaxID=3344580 RepID=UPI0035BF046A